MSEQTHQDLLDWLARDDEVRISPQTAPLLRDLDSLPESDRQAVIDWLGMVGQADSPIVSEAEEALVARLDDEPSKASVIAWLLQSRAILESNVLSGREKLGKLCDNKPPGSGLGAIRGAGEAAIAKYKRLPLPLRVALPATVLAAPLVGGAGVGIAAFGGAIGVPVLLVLFLGVSGITSMMASLLDTEDEGRIFVQGVLALIATDAAMMRLRQESREAIAKDIRTPRKHPMPKASNAVLAKLLTLSPLEFERHVMSLFSEAGMTAWVTPAGSDGGIDGVAKDGERLILVQCKRYAVEHPVGRPAIQQFKGVIEENGADLGVFVVTSSFTAQALESAGKSERLLLVDSRLLSDWHENGVSLPSAV